MRAVCVTCGTYYRESPAAPRACLICEDERQWVRWEGQAWIEPDALRSTHRVVAAPDHGVLGFDIAPTFAIGQRALLVETPEGNLLWDCIPLLDAEAVAAIEARGGLRGIAISHPHFYSAMADWSDAFGGAPIWLHADDAAWVQEPHPAIRHWEGERLPLWGDLTLVRCGGHFPGSTVLHRAADGGELFVGDTLAVCQDRHWVTFMYSYPNDIPLGPAAVRRIASALEPFRFERIYGSSRLKNVAGDGTAVLERSVARFLAAIG